MLERKVHWRENLCSRAALEVGGWGKVTWKPHSLTAAWKAQDQLLSH